LAWSGVSVPFCASAALPALRPFPADPGGGSLLEAVSFSPLLFIQLGDVDAPLLAGTLGAALYMAGSAIFCRILLVSSKGRGM